MVGSIAAVVVDSTAAAVAVAGSNSLAAVAVVVGETEDKALPSQVEEEVESP